MNKIFTFVFTVVSFVAIMSCVTSNINCYASDEITTMTSENDSNELDVTVYDLNNDGQYTVADLVIAKNAVNNGTLAESDYHNIYRLMNDMPVKMKIQEFNLDNILVTPATIEWLATKLTGYCTSVSFDGKIFEVTLLNNGRVTKLLSSTVEHSETIIGRAASDDIIWFGVSSNQEFAVDSWYSFYLWEINKYEMWDLDDMTSGIATDLIDRAGKFQYFVVEDDQVRFFFNNGVTDFEICVQRIDEIETPIETFVFEGEFITIGVTADGEIALDTMSFDIAS